MNTKIIIIAVVVVGGIFALINMQGGSSSNTEEIQSEVGNQETQSEEVSVATVPLDMPNVPMYPGAVLQTSTESNTDTERNVTLSLATDDSVSDVIMWYRGALDEGGWAVTGDKNVGGYVLLEGESENIKTFVQAAERSDLGKIVITQRVRVR